MDRSESSGRGRNEYLIEIPADCCEKNRALLMFRKPTRNQFSAT
jgi:hypothetical protein